jgi:hypothetical protein
LVLAVFALANDRRESPHKLPVSIFKERPGACRVSRALCGIPLACQLLGGDFSSSGFSAATVVSTPVTAEGRAV